MPAAATAVTTVTERIDGLRALGCVKADEERGRVRQGAGLPESKNLDFPQGHDAKVAYPLTVDGRRGSGEDVGANQYRCSWVELEGKLVDATGKTLGEVDTAHVFDITRTNPKVTGIAGDVVEQSVIGYPANSDQEPDLVIDGVETELKTTGLRRSKKGKGFEAKEPMSITAVSLETIAGEDFRSSNFWHKLEHMLIVYYLYDSETTVPAAEYANFPIEGAAWVQISALKQKTARWLPQ